MTGALMDLPMLSTQQQRSERICECADICEYHVSRIRTILKLRVRFGYPTLKELAASIFEPYQGYDSDHSPSFGPTCDARWSMVISEVEQAERNGIHNADAIAISLCPFACDDIGDETC